jgi:hypothetical protein
MTRLLLTFDNKSLTGITASPIKSSVLKNKLIKELRDLRGRHKEYSQSNFNFFSLKLLLNRSLGITMLIFGCRGTYRTRGEGSKGQRVKKIISENIDARNMEFGQNVYF